VFKQSSFENEIYQSMEKSLVKNQSEQLHGLNKISKAIDNLNAAAEIFENAGMIEPASEITKVLQDLAVEQLTSKAFSINDLIGLDKQTLHHLLEMSTPAQLMLFAKKVLSVIKGDKSSSEVLEESLKESDLSDPKVREKVISKLMTALKVAKFFV